ncbi:RagB/SusD family nutrient uptake outer membrane protein [Hymenobacter sp. H14-R3]|uniref:RagB/SusD family nutrient uptake outer membrane protein n=1 Tax=Hymenobacter sp. H14-R3 TaxID=3046308 RepID=UPI0024BBC39E|nr:RagB/SusD family nutrient uptake outer membrane protein [Hymenobacter sp. H14-R3]MDJ0363546.1 RagB/SusD family nutrient uptake outer membrane protein [Hymenobacter sp. H14-R3]
MKNNFIWPACVLALGLSLAGCKDALDIAPLQSIDAATGYNTSQKVAAAVVGAYARLDNARLYGSDLVLVPELLAGDGYVNWDGSFQNYRQIRAHTQIATLSNAEGIWTQAYAAINQCNLVLANLDVVTDPGQKSQYEGEVSFIRGTMYFELVRLYAQQYQAGGANAQPGVPINLVPVTTTEQADIKLARSTVQEVYAQVIKDLQNAITKLPAQNVSRASKYSAEAMLARVYLQQGNYAAARTAANDVITNSGSTLVGSVAAVFANRNSAESLFEIQQNDQNNAGTSNDGLATYFAGYSPNGDQTVLYGRGDVSIRGIVAPDPFYSKSYYDRFTGFAALYDSLDVRGPDTLSAITTKKLIYRSDGNNRSGRLRTLKWRTYGQNIPVVRLAEMYLIRAEGDVRAGNTASATRDVNTIRARSGATPYQAATLDIVLRERQLELAFEGFRIHDLRRTNRIVIAAIAAKPATADAPATPAVPAVLASDQRFILPIPQREINNNSLLTQNAGY